MHPRLLFLLLFYLLWRSSLGQVTLSPFHPLVTVASDTLAFPFAGGLNSPQYQTTDLDGDQDLDLVVLDRTSNTIICFENKDNKYVLNLSFARSFPLDIQHWMVLADFDCDGIKDLFTYTNLGIRVFKHSLKSGTSEWTLIQSPLRYKGASSMVNIFFSPLDIPSIVDIDGDGDLDILAFNFYSSLRIAFYKNESKDKTNTCDFAYIKQTSAYGKILDCGCDAFKVGDDCSSGGRVLHAGNKSILSLDYNRDGKMDILLGQEGCYHLNFSTHTGTYTAPSFTTFASPFPHSDAVQEFPAAFYEDINFDHKKDLIIACNASSNREKTIDFQKSSFVYTHTGNSTPSTYANKKAFLQDQMIDVGEYAYPVVFDVNNDGISDLVIGNKSTLIDSKHVGTLTYYQSDGRKLTHQTNDLYSLSSLGFQHLNCHFVDLNGDSAPDLFMSVTDTIGRKLFYYILQINRKIKFDYKQIIAVDFPLFFFEDYALEDANGDGKLDLLIGLFNGRLDLYSNQSDEWPATFALATEGYLGIMGSYENSNLALAIGDIDGDGLSDLSTVDRSGVLKVYSNYRSGNDKGESELVKYDELTPNQPTHFKINVFPHVGPLLDRLSILFGSVRGGVMLFSGDKNPLNDLRITVYPIPTDEDQIINVTANLSQVVIEIIDMMGRVLLAQVLPDAYHKVTIATSSLPTGIYLVRARKDAQKDIVKIIIDK